MTSREIILTFNRNIEPSSVNVTGISIQGVTGFITNTSLYYRLTSARSIQVENTTVTIGMSEADYNALQLRPGVATSDSNTYLTNDPETVTDDSSQQNMAQPISATDALPVWVFVADTVSPELVAFSLNLEATTMTLTFNEPVLVNTFSAQHILLSSHLDSSTGVSYSLTGGVADNSSALASSLINVHLSDSDALSLKVNMDIATGRENTYISVSQGLVLDTNGNPNSETRIQVSNFTADTSAPRLVRFDLDLTLETLTMQFDDVINASTFNASGVTLQNAQASEPMQSISLDLVQDISIIPDYEVIILVQLSADSLNNLKQMRNLCTSIQNCYMAVTSVARDPFGRTNIPITGSEALPAHSFSEDQIAPELDSWSLDMNAGRIHLSFSETVDITTFQVDHLTLQSSVGNDASFYTLTNYSELNPADAANTFEVRLDTDDLNTIKANYIGTNPPSSFLSLTEGAILDMNGNSIVSISSNQALSVNDYILDTTPPSLVSFSANLYTGVLILTFDEIVDASTFDASSLIMVNPTSSVVYHLTNTSYGSQMDSTIIHVTMSESDLNVIRSIDNFATSVNNMYLSVQPQTVFDTIGNQLNSIPLSSPLQVSNFVDSPILISFVDTNYVVREGETLTLQILLNATTVSGTSFGIMTEDNRAIGKLRL